MADYDLIFRALEAARTHFENRDEANALIRLADARWSPITMLMRDAIKAHIDARERGAVGKEPCPEYAPKRVHIDGGYCGPDGMEPLPQPIAVVREALGLLNSMVACGEKHSEQSKATFRRAKYALYRLEGAADKVDTASSGEGAGLSTKAAARVLDEAPVGFDGWWRKSGPTLAAKPRREAAEAAWTEGRRCLLREDDDRTGTEPPRLRPCEKCKGPGPCLWADSGSDSQRYLCAKCHPTPDDPFFHGGRHYPRSTWEAALREKHAEEDAAMGAPLTEVQPDPAILAKCEVCGKVAYPAEDHAKCIVEILNECIVEIRSAAVQENYGPRHATTAQKGMLYAMLREGVLTQKDDGPINVEGLTVAAASVWIGLGNQRRAASITLGFTPPTTPDAPAGGYTRWRDGPPAVCQGPPIAEKGMTKSYVQPDDDQGWERSPLHERDLPGYGESDRVDLLTEAVAKIQETIFNATIRSSDNWIRVGLPPFGDPKRGELLEAMRRYFGPPVEVTEDMALWESARETGPDTTMLDAVRAEVRPSEPSEPPAERWQCMKCKVEGDVGDGSEQKHACFALAISMSGPLAKATGTKAEDWRAEQGSGKDAGGFEVVEPKVGYSEGPRSSLVRERDGIAEAWCSTCGGWREYVMRGRDPVGGINPGPAAYCMDCKTMLPGAEPTA